MIQNIVLIIILLTLAYLYEEFKKLRITTEAYSDFTLKTNDLITQLCNLIDHNSEMEEKILNKIAEKLEERGNE